MPLTLLRRSTRTHKPSHTIRNLQAGEGTISAQGVPMQTKTDPQMPELHDIEEEEEEVGGVWTIEDSVPALLENFIGLKHTFMAETSNSEALEPNMLAEAKH